MTIITICCDIKNNYKHYKDSKTCIYGNTSLQNADVLLILSSGAMKSAKLIGVYYAEETQQVLQTCGNNCYLKNVRFEMAMVFPWFSLFVLGLQALSQPLNTKNCPANLSSCDLHLHPAGSQCNCLVDLGRFSRVAIAHYDILVQFNLVYTSLISRHLQTSSSICVHSVGLLKKYNV